MGGQKSVPSGRLPNDVSQMAATRPDVRILPGGSFERTRRRLYSRSMYAEPATYDLHAGDRHANAHVLSAPRPALQRETGESLAVGLSSPPL